MGDLGAEYRGRGPWLQGLISESCSRPRRPRCSKGAVGGYQEKGASQNTQTEAMEEARSESMAIENTAL